MPIGRIRICSGAGSFTGVGKLSSPLHEACVKGWPGVDHRCVLGTK